MKIVEENVIKENSRQSRKAFIPDQSIFMSFSNMLFSIKYYYK